MKKVKRVIGPSPQQWMVFVKYCLNKLDPFHKSDSVYNLVHDTNAYYEGGLTNTYQDVDGNWLDKEDGNYYGDIVIEDRETFNLGEEDKRIIVQAMKEDHGFRHSALENLPVFVEYYPSAGEQIKFNSDYQFTLTNFERLRFYYHHWRNSHTLTSHSQDFAEAIIKELPLGDVFIKEIMDE